MELEHAQEENDLNFGIRQYYIYSDMVHSRICKLTLDGETNDQFESSMHTILCIFRIYFKR